MSPANSLLYMDGVVDKAYNEVMFPDIRHSLQEVAKFVCPTNKTGQFCLKVGSALAMEAASNTWLIAAPTRWGLQDVSSTNNAYHATKAALICADAIPHLRRLIVPAMCCGYGKMSAALSAIVKRPCPPSEVGGPWVFLLHGC